MAKLQAFPLLSRIRAWKYSWSDDQMVFEAQVAVYRHPEKRGGAIVVRDVAPFEKRGLVTPRPSLSSKRLLRPLYAPSMDSLYNKSSCYLDFRTRYPQEMDDEWIVLTPEEADAREIRSEYGEPVCKKSNVWIFD